MRVPATSLSTNPDVSDEQVVARVLQGEKNYYEVLVRRHNLKLYRIARGILKEEEEIQDVMQEAYLKAFEKLYQFKGKSSFSTWLIRILINAAFARFNEQKRMPVTNIESVKEELGFVEDDHTSDNKADMTASLRSALEKAIGSLPSRYRSVFMLRELEALSVADTAFCLDISEDNVKVRLHRAKEMLKSILRQGFHDVDLFEFRGPRCDMMTERVMKAIQSMSSTAPQ